MAALKRRVQLRVFRAHHLAYVIYTSAHGQPKGVAIEHTPSDTGDWASDVYARRISGSCGTSICFACPCTDLRPWRMADDRPRTNAMGLSALAGGDRPMINTALSNGGDGTDRRDPRIVKTVISQVNRCREAGGRSMNPVRSGKSMTCTALQKTRLTRRTFSGSRMRRRPSDGRSPTLRCTSSIRRDTSSRSEYRASCISPATVSRAGISTVRS